MAKFRLDKFKPIVALGVFLAAWWIVPTLSKSFLPFVKLSFTEFQAPAWIVSSYLDDLESFWARRSHSKIELIEAGQELARQKAFYQLLDQRNKSLETEVMRLESILDMPSRREFRYQVARVIRRDLNAWWQQLIIRKGFRAHIDSYSAFYENDRDTPTGLAGYLRERGYDKVVLAGLATDFCVGHSALDAARHGFKTTVVMDACRAIDLDGSLAAAEAQMRAAGVVLTESVSLAA